MAFLTELDAVNLIRGSVGKAPVSSLTTTNPDVIAAQLRLKNSCTELQTKSWWFNTELSFQLSPNTTDEILIPNNALEVRTQDPFTYLTTRGNRIYNPRDNTYKFTEPVTVEMLLRLDFSELPYVAANFVQYDAARKFQADFDGDPMRIRDLRDDTMAAWLRIRESEQRNRRSNILLSAGSLRMQSGVLPLSHNRLNFRPGD
jgi:hypothetical protein